tara:strand:+ start:72 stop:608 length:537 start_codon:yes stop_codon:yes gene_type:complete
MQMENKVNLLMQILQSSAPTHPAMPNMSQMQLGMQAAGQGMPQQMPPQHTQSQLAQLAAASPGSWPQASAHLEQQTGGRMVAAAHGAAAGAPAFAQSGQQLLSSSVDLMKRESILNGQNSMSGGTLMEQLGGLQAMSAMSGVPKEAEVHGLQHLLEAAQRYQKEEPTGGGGRPALVQM